MPDGYFTLYIFVPGALHSNGFHRGEYSFSESILRYLARDSNKGNSWYVCVNRSSLNFTSSSSSQLLFSHVQLFCHPMDCSLPGSSVYEIFQARLLEWFAIFFSRGSSGLRDQTCGSCLPGIFFTTEPPRKPLLLFYWVILSPNSSIK